MARRRRRRSTSTSTGSARKAAPISRPAASSMVFSHCGIPAEAGVPFPSAGRCRCRPAQAAAVPGTAGGPAPSRAVTVPPGCAGCGTVSTVPGRIMSGSGPMTRRLAAYRAGQPPRTANRAAMPASVSPGCTTYLAAGRLPGTNAAATLSVLATVTSVVLLAMRVLAWAGRTDPLPDRRHDDQQDAPGEHHARGLRRTYAQCCHFPSKGISAGRCRPGRRGHEPAGRKGLKRAAPPGDRRARRTWRRRDAPAAARPERAA